MGDIADKPTLLYAFTLNDGTILERVWTWREIDAGGGPEATDPPDWLLNPRRSWPDPGGPMVFTGSVMSGHEGDAHRFLGLEASGE